MPFPSPRWFWGLCVLQGATVLAPRALHAPWLTWIRARWLLFVAPLGLVIAATFVPAVSEALASSLTTIALVLVPPTAALGLGWACVFGRPWLVLLVPLALGVALATPESYAGEAATIVLVGSSAAAVAAVVVAVVPRLFAILGILGWAALDVSTAISRDLERSSEAITSATPPVAPQLQLQRVELGNASMEYADLFIAAALGALLATMARPRMRAAAIVTGLGVAMSPLFDVVDVLPGTAPVAVALLVELAAGRRRDIATP